MTDAPAPDATAAPRDKRSGVIIRATIDLGGTTVERRVRNLSQHGACVDNDEDLVAGTSVRVTMGRLEGLIADVVWTERRLAGLRFRRTVDLEAARQPRGLAVAQAGWVGTMNNAYRRRA